MLKDRSVRLLAFILFVAGCFGTTGGIEASKGDDGDPMPPPFGGAPCGTSADCQLAGPTCCECPTFATNVGDPKVDACEDVGCPPGQCPDNVEAACDPNGGFCVLACKAVACAADSTCMSGFHRDGNGCLSCTCDAPTGNAVACFGDTDCVQTRKDCCGCALGGSDTAVPASEQRGFDDALMCEASPQCSGFDNCRPGEAPRCVHGTCELLPDRPANACGTPDLPPCPNGTFCVVNANDQANLYGVGICQPM